MSTKQITVIYSRYSTQSIDFLQLIPENVDIVDWSCPINSKTGRYRLAMIGRDRFNKPMITPKDYIENGGISNVKTKGCVVVKIPGYSVAATDENDAYNVDSTIQIIQPTTWNEVETLVNSVNQRATDNPIIDDLPEPTPLVLNNFKEGIDIIDNGVKAALGESS